MTSSDPFAAIRRYWYLVLSGALLTALGAFLAISGPNVYWVDFEIVVLPPPADAAASNVLMNPPEQLTAVASVLVAEFNQGATPYETASPDAPLYGLGVRDGERVALRNTGGQWATSIGQAVIDVQVTGTTEPAVTGRAAAVRDRLTHLLTVGQSGLGVRPRYMVRMASFPQAPTIERIGPNHKRAAVAVLTLGLLCTWLSVGLATEVTRRHNRSSAATDVVAHVGEGRPTW